MSKHAREKTLGGKKKKIIEDSCCANQKYVHCLVQSFKSMKVTNKAAKLSSKKNHPHLIFQSL